MVNTNNIHLIGLASDGGVHSHIDHIIALAKIAQNQPEFSALPDLKGLGNVYESPVQQFKTILEGIGGKVIEFSDWSEIKSFVKEHFEAKLFYFSKIGS